MSGSTAPHGDTFHAFADAFDRLATSLEQAKQQDAKVEHLSDNLDALGTQAGRRLWDALKLGALKSLWPGLLPGEVYAYRPTEDGKKQVRRDEKDLDDRFFRLVWRDAGRTLEQAFPARFVRPDGFAKDFVAYQKDSDGNAILRDGAFVPMTDGYDSADWMQYQRVRTQSYADSGRLLAELLRRESNQQGPVATRGNVVNIYGNLYQHTGDGPMNLPDHQHNINLSGSQNVACGSQNIAGGNVTAGDQVSAGRDASVRQTDSVAEKIWGWIKCAGAAVARLFGWKL